jgi:hypothetical protein
MADATFRDGIKYSNGEAATITKVKASKSSNRVTTYHTFLWSDGTTSCDCPGWYFKKKDQERDCKHCKASRKVQFADMHAPDAVTDSPQTVAAVQKHTERLSTLRKVKV